MAGTSPPPLPVHSNWIIRWLSDGITRNNVCLMVFFGGFLSISWKRLINTSLKSVPYEIGYIYIYFDSNFFENIFENKKTIRDCPRVEHRKTWCRIRMRSLILVRAYLNRFRLLSRRKYPCNQTGEVIVGGNIVSRLFLQRVHSFSHIISCAL